MHRPRVRSAARKVAISSSRMHFNVNFTVEQLQPELLARGAVAAACARPLRGCGRLGRRGGGGGGRVEASRRVQKRSTFATSSQNSLWPSSQARSGPAPRNRRGAHFLHHLEGEFAALVGQAGVSSSSARSISRFLDFRGGQRRRHSAACGAAWAAAAAAPIAPGSWRGLVAELRALRWCVWG